MKKSLLIIFTFLLGAVSALGQSYVAFEHSPKMQLPIQNEYRNYQVKYKATEKSTIYLELKKGNLIVANGIINIPKAMENTESMTIKVKDLTALTNGDNYSYNLYMYSGGRNDWSKKACRSVSIQGVKMSGTKKQLEKPKRAMSLSNFFN